MTQIWLTLGLCLVDCDDYHCYSFKLSLDYH